MEEKIFDYIDEIYEVIFMNNYDYRKSKPALTELKNKIEKEEFTETAYYYQLIATIEFFIQKSKIDNTPYHNLLPKNDKIYNDFNKSLDLDGNNPPLRYLYAMYLYDIGDFYFARKQFINIDIQYYLDMELEDRVLKINELVLCCSIFQNDTSEYKIMDFLKSLRFSENGLYPSDLVDTLLSTKKYISNTIKSEFTYLMNEFGIKENSIDWYKDV